MRSELLIELQHVSVVRGEKPVLHDLSLELAGGEHLAILGPNGSGKSTLIKILTRELYPLAHPETVVRLFGRSRWDVSQLRRRLGVVSAEPVSRSTAEITGFEAVLTGFFASSRLWPSLHVTDAMRHRADDLLHRANADHLRNTMVGAMSSGEQRKVMIARALAGSGVTESTSSVGVSKQERDLDMLLLDEPSNSLDVGAQRDLHQTLRQLAQVGTTILLITHHIADIIPEMQRVLLLKDGTIFRQGARSSLLTSETLSRLFETPVEVTDRGGILSAH